MSSEEHLLDQLSKGFYVDNLYRMASACRQLSRQTGSPAPFFVMQHIFLDIAAHWEDRPLPVEEAKQVENKITKPIQALLMAVMAQASIEQTYDRLNEVLSAYFSMFS